MAQISDMIVDALVQDLESALTDPSLPESEKVGVARGGKLQDNPVKARIYVLVHINDPDTESEWEDISAADEGSGLAERHFYAPAFEVGGGSLFWRRFTVEFGLFGIKTKEDRDEARRIANLIKGRIERTIALSSSVTALQDELGETAIKILPMRAVISEGGGPPTSFIWRGRVRFQVLTWRPF